LPEQNVCFDEGLDESHALLEVDDVAAGSLDQEEVAAKKIRALLSLETI
jgi:hypothetical protein